MMCNYLNKKTIFVSGLTLLRMFLFGYMSSLVVAIGLAVFYLGNITHQLVISAQDDSAKEIRVQQSPHYDTSSYFIFETQTEFITKAISAVTSENLSAVSYIPFYITIRYYCNNDKPPLEACNLALFNRPPPCLS